MRVVGKTQRQMLIRSSLDSMVVPVDGAIGIHETAQTGPLIVRPCPDPTRNVHLMRDFVTCRQSQLLQLFHQAATGGRNATAARTRTALQRGTYAKQRREEPLHVPTVGRVGDGVERRTDLIPAPHAPIAQHDANELGHGRRLPWTPDGLPHLESRINRRSRMPPKPGAGDLTACASSGYCTKSAVDLLTTLTAQAGGALHVPEFREDC